MQLDMASLKSKMGAPPPPPTVTQTPPTSQPSSADTQVHFLQQQLAAVTAMMTASMQHTVFRPAAASLSGYGTPSRGTPPVHQPVLADINQLGKFLFSAESLRRLLVVSRWWLTAVSTVGTWPLCTAFTSCTVRTACSLCTVRTACTLCTVCTACTLYTVLTACTLCTVCTVCTACTPLLSLILYTLEMPAALLNIVDS